MVDCGWEGRGGEGKGETYSSDRCLDRLFDGIDLRGNGEGEYRYVDGGQWEV